MGDSMTLYDSVSLFCYVDLIHVCCLYDSYFDSILGVGDTASVLLLLSDCVVKRCCPTPLLWLKDPTWRNIFWEMSFTAGRES